MCDSSSSLLTMQRRSTSLSGGVAYALYSYKVTRAIAGYTVHVHAHIMFIEFLIAI